MDKLCLPRSGQEKVKKFWLWFPTLDSDYIWLKTNFSKKKNFWPLTPPPLGFVAINPSWPRGGRPKRSAWPLLSRFFFDAFPNTIKKNYHDFGQKNLNIYLMWQILKENIFKILLDLLARHVGQLTVNVLAHATFYPNSCFDTGHSLYAPNLY